MEKGNKIILVMGILAFIASAFVRYEASSFIKKAVLTEGEVVYVLGSSYRIQYSIEDGTEKTFQGSGKNHPFHEKDIVKIWYRTDNPDRVRLSDGKKNSGYLFIAGIVCVLLGVYPLFRKKKTTIS